MRRERLLVLADRLGGVVTYAAVATLVVGGAVYAAVAGVRCSDAVFVDTVEALERSAGRWVLVDDGDVGAADVARFGGAVEVHWEAIGREGRVLAAGTLARAGGVVAVEARQRTHPMASRSVGIDARGGEALDGHEGLSLAVRTSPCGAEELWIVFDGASVPFTFERALRYTRAD